MMNHERLQRRTRRHIIAALLVAVADGPLWALAQGVAEAEKDALAAEILDKADRIRFPSES